ncbi:MAG: hypothetical protein ACOCVN_01465 [bacterium]
MKKLNYILVVCLTLIFMIPEITLASFANNQQLPSDTIPKGENVVLELKDVRGEIQWQRSTNQYQWQNIENENDLKYSYAVDSSSRQNLTFIEDTLFIEPGLYRGQLTWEVSKNLSDWFEIKDFNDRRLEIFDDSLAYYRAKIKEGLCNPIYSNVVRVKDSIQYEYRLANGEVQLTDKIIYNDLSIVTPFETTGVDSNGNFVVPISDSANYKIIFVEMKNQSLKSENIDSEIQFIGLCDSSNNFIANDSTTVLSLLLINPLLLYLNEEQLKTYKHYVTTNDTFNILVDSLRFMRDKEEYFLELVKHKGFYQLMSNLFSSAFNMSCTS